MKGSALSLVLGAQGLVWMGLKPILLPKLGRVRDPQQGPLSHVMYFSLMSKRT